MSSVKLEEFDSCPRTPSDAKVLCYKVVPARNPTYLAAKKVKYKHCVIQVNKDRQLAFHGRLLGVFHFCEVRPWLSRSYERDT